jgi:hypothetical protein
LPGEKPVIVGDTGSVENKIQLWFDRIVEHDRTKMSEGLRAFVESEVGVGKKTWRLFVRHSSEMGWSFM